MCVQSERVCVCVLAVCAKKRVSVPCVVCLSVFESNSHLPIPHRATHTHTVTHNDTPTHTHTHTYYSDRANTHPVAHTHTHTWPNNGIVCLGKAGRPYYQCCGQYRTPNSISKLGQQQQLQHSPDGAWAISDVGAKNKNPLTSCSLSLTGLICKANCRL